MNVPTSIWFSPLSSVSVRYQSAVSTGCTRRSFCFVMTRRRRTCCSCCARPLRSRRETWWRLCCQVRGADVPRSTDLLQCQRLARGGDHILNFTAFSGSLLVQRASNPCFSCSLPGLSFCFQVNELLVK